MRTLDPTLGSRLQRTGRRWRTLLFWRATGFLIVGLVTVVLLLGVLMQRGVLDRVPVAVAAFVGVLLLGGLGLLVVLIVVSVTRRDRAWFAAELEKVNSPLLDRVNTLVYLEDQAGEDTERDIEIQSYAARIAEQARRELTWAVKPFESLRRQANIGCLGALALFVATLFFFQKYEPFDRLGRSAMAAEQRNAEQPFPELEPPAADAAEVRGREERAWGEVRITAPGRDLKVTKVDVVPLQIEAASSQPLEAARWLSATTGAEPLEHPLPAPPEPRYAVYRPMLYVDEFRLSDWDVLTYHAAASSAGGSYASEIYFLEVRPFREEIQKLPGGEGGMCYKSLSQLTGLIDGQKRVLRQTHRFLALSRAESSDETRRAEDQGKLVAAESDLTEAVRHLYAEIATEMENMPIAEVLDHLAGAEEWLEQSTGALRDDVETAPKPEQSALAELVATRKSLQKSISENPSAFAPPPDEEMPPVAELPDKLERISEFRDEEKAAQEVIEQVLEQQRGVSEQLEQEGPYGQEELAAEQEAARQRLEQFREEHPAPFEGAEAEAEAADSAMREAGDAMNSDPESATSQQAQAVERLEELLDEMNRQTESRQLTHAYKLKDVIEEQAEQMGEMAGNPGDSSQQDAQQAAEQAQSATDELRQIVEEEPAGDAFGPGLGEALGGDNRERLESRLDQLAEAGEEGERGEAAGEAKSELDRVLEAFEESAPRLVKEMRENDPLQGGDLESLEQALQQLRSMLAREGRGSADDAQKEAQKRDAMANLRRGLEGVYGNQDRTKALLERAEEELEKKDVEVDGPRLRRLIDEIEMFRVEMSDAFGDELEGPDLEHIDVADLPAEYRERIQNYYRKLSEQ
ncbi:MAG: hypothetical protein GY719_38395 [bacterium]|nr:hypothetical protein [bacterium]